MLDCSNAYLKKRAGRASQHSVEISYISTEERPNGANYIDPTTGLFGAAIVGFSDGEITVNVPEPSTLIVFCWVY
jgi:hypothetical protein